MAEAPGPQGADDPITRPLAYGPPYDPTPAREKIRGRLAQLVVWAIVAYPVVAFGLLVVGRITVQDLPAVAGVTAPLAGIAGAAIGFYVGSEDRR